MANINFNYRKLLIYFLFWAVSFYVILGFFSRTDGTRLIDIIYTFLFILPFMVVVTIHSYHFIPNYLAQSKFWLYGLSSFLLLGFTIIAYNFSFLFLSEWFFPGYYLVATYDPHEVIGFAVLFLLISSSLEFARYWFEGLQAKKMVSELKTENIASELKALRAQVNPHFLFNSLNTIYNEALKKSDKAPQLILKLSDMLRYVVDKMNQDKVLLGDEINYLKNFITLHKQRLNDPEKVSFDLDGNTGSQKIAPLLLINFIENCFKHADLTTDDSFISIRLALNDSDLILHCQNTMYIESSSRPKNTGAGLQNAKRRLELAYAERHNLEISEDEKVYSLKLNMKLE